MTKHPQHHHKPHKERMSNQPTLEATQHVIDAAAATDPGWRYKENQDAVLLDTHIRQAVGALTKTHASRVLIGVADGVASGPCAAKASRMVLTELSRLANDTELVGKFARTIQHRMTSIAAGTRCEGMASTLAAIQLSGDTVRVVSVGDTRVYRQRNGGMAQISVDHTIAQQMLHAGDITKEEARTAGSLYSDLGSALVASEFEEHFDIFGTTDHLCAGDRWLCVSDGITSALDDAAIARLLSNAESSAEQIARDIVKTAKRVRASDDNLSAAVAIVRALNNPAGCLAKTEDSGE